MKMLKKTLVSFFILSLIITPQTASALLNLEQNYPSPTESMDSIMNDLGVDKSEVKENIDETLNVIDYKKDAPSVNLTFVPESPMENKKLTALANPANFTGDPERMYYTWYLKHKGCEKAERGDSDYKATCDVNGDAAVDEEDWKIEAMGILARGDWNPDYASKDIAETTLDEDNNGYEDDYDRYYEMVQEDKGSDPDKDGYDSVFGGEDQEGKPAHCYVKDIEAGIDYEIHDGPGELGTGGATGYGDEGSDQLPVDISEVDFSGSFAATITGDVRQFSIGPFLQSVVIPDVQQSPGRAIFDYAPRAWPPIWNPIGKDFTCNIREPGCTEPQPIPGGSNSQGDRCEDWCASSEDPAQCAQDFCSDGIPWIIWEVKSGDEYTGRWMGERMEWLRPTQIDKPEAWNTKLPDPPSGGQIVDGCKAYGFMVSAYGNSTEGSGGKIANSVNERTNIVSVTTPGEDCESICRHVFPKKYYVDFDRSDTLHSGRNDAIRFMSEDDEDILVGDPDENSFTNEEEMFWGTDPESKDTNNDGVPDEKALTGLGMNSFSWTYKKGDLIGVALEGVSDNTNYKDSSFKTMWGMPNNDFEGEGEENQCEINPSTMIDGTGSDMKEYKITAGTDLNDCLEENFVDPTKGTADTKIEVTFSYSPQNPINDKYGNNSDTLTVKANLSNVENESFVKYEWLPYVCLDKADDQCTLLDRNKLQDYHSGLIKTSGIGINSVKMNLQLPVNTLYLKFELQVLETTEDAGEKSGKGKIFIPLQHTSDDIVPQKVQATENLSLPTDVILTQNGPRYTDLPAECPEKTCSTVKNEIISLRFNGADVTNKILSWSLDGKPLMASGSDPRTVYFPVLKDQGNDYSVKLTIADTDGDNLGKEKIILARNFKVEDPQVEIGPENCTPPTEEASTNPCILVEEGRLLNPLDRTAVLEIDYNKNLFQGERNSIILIRPTLNFDRSALREKDIQGGPIDIWFIDGTPADQTDIDANGNLRLQLNKEAGEKYRISFEALHTQPMLIKRALGNIWHVPDASFYEKKVGDSLEIEVIEAPAAGYQSGTKKIMASVFSGMPNYLNFLFRTVLTLALILFMANLSFILFPKQGRY